jgi:hypothetical protein
MKGRLLHARTPFTLVDIDPLPKSRARSCERILVPRQGLERVL